MLTRTRKLVLWSVPFVAIALGACSETGFEEATGKANIRGVNAIADSPSAAFLIEETPINTSLGYKSISSPESYDDLSYNFNFDIPIPLTNPRRIGTQFVDIVRDTDYTFVLAGSVSAPQVLLLERPIRVWDGSETVFDLAFAHLNNTAGDIDIYFGAPGTVPVSGAAVASLSFGGDIPPMDYPAGDYQIIATVKDDPATILYESSAFTLSSSISYIATFFDADPSITAPVSMRLLNLNGAATEVPDANFGPTLQIIHAAFGTGNVDVAANGDFTSLFASNIAFGDVTADLVATTDATTYTYAATGNTNALIEDTDRILPAGSRSTAILAGAPGSLQLLALPSARRGIATVAQFRITNATVNGDSVDVYFVDPGDSIDSLLPNIIALPFGSATAVTQQIAQNFDVVVTANGEKTPIYGPSPLTLNANDLVELVIVDTVDPNVADVIVFSNINP